MTVSGVSDEGKAHYTRPPVPIAALMTLQVESDLVRPVSSDERPSKARSL